MKKALEGVTVLDLGQVYNGPYCSLMLAYQGAKVIKVEPLEGENLRKRRNDCHEFLMFNSNKMSVSLNLKTEEGKEIFLQLVKKADILVENFTIGAMDRLGLGYDVLKEANPRLIYATGKGYGLEGPYANWSAMDLTVQAISGVVSSTGYQDGPPVKAGPALCDILGGIHLFGGILTALYQREHTGEGQVVEVSMHDATYPALASPLGAYYNTGGQLPQRTGNRHSGLAIAPYSLYPAKDGYIVILANQDTHWHNLARVMGREDLIDDPRFKTNQDRVRHMELLDETVADWSRTLEKWKLVELLQKVRVPSAPVLDIPEVANDPHLLHRQMIREIEHPTVGTIRVPGSPIRLTDSPLDEVVAAPLLGQHTEQVLKELVNLDDEILSKLREKAVIR